MVETNSFKKTESLTQWCVCVGCQLNSDQTLGLLRLKGHVRARLDSETTPVDKKRVNSCVLKHPLFWWSSATKKSAQKTRKYSLWRVNVTISRFRGWRSQKEKGFLKLSFARFSLIHQIGAKDSDKLFASLTETSHGPVPPSRGARKE